MSDNVKTQTLEVHRIRLDGGTQIRERVDDETVREYADQMRDGAVFPPVIVVYDQKDYWLADGFHRLHARRQLPLEQPTIDCLVHEGSLRDAILLAVQANATHGLRRTNQDKRRAVETILADEEWSQKSTRWVAKTCGVGQGLVEDVRRQLPDSGSWPEGGCLFGRLGQDGKRRAAPKDSAAELAADPISAALACASAFDVVVAHVRRAQSEGERLAEGPGGRFLGALRLNEFRSHLKGAADALAATRPARRCTYCRGDGCEICRDAGWTCPDLD